MATVQQPQRSMDVDKLIELLQEKKMLNKIIGKRPGVPKLPAQLYLRLVLASVATEKDMSACISTALETYTMRNFDKHFAELKIKAAAIGKTPEEFLIDIVCERLG